VVPALTEDLIAEAMARAEKVACTPGDHRCLPLPFDVTSAHQTCTPKGRCTIGGTRRVIVADAGRKAWDVWLDMQRPAGTRRGPAAAPSAVSQITAGPGSDTARERAGRTSGRCATPALPDQHGVPHPVWGWHAELLEKQTCPCAAQLAQSAVQDTGLMMQTRAGPPLRFGLQVPQGQLGPTSGSHPKAQTPLPRQTRPPAQLVHAPPSWPQASVLVPGRQVVPAQHPAHPVQVSVSPHPSDSVPHVWFCAAQVVGVQPQTPGVPPPPQVSGVVQVQVPPHPLLTSQTSPAQLGTHGPQTLLLHG
jgi:hypothetical protein